MTLFVDTETITTCNKLFTFYPINPFSFFDNNILLDETQDPVPITITEFEMICDLIKYNWQPQHLENVPLCEMTEFRDTISFSLVRDVFALQHSNNQIALERRTLIQGKVCVSLYLIFCFINNIRQ